MTTPVVCGTMVTIPVTTKAIRYPLWRRKSMTEQELKDRIEHLEKMIDDVWFVHIPRLKERIHELECPTPEDE